MKTKLTLAVLLATTGMALPAAADSGTYSCTTVVGTQVRGPNGNPYGATFNAAGFGVGGCNVRVLDSPSRLLAKDTAENCQITVDLGGNHGPDQKVDGLAKVGKVYPTETVFDAFCEAGTIAVESSITLEGA